MKVLIIEDEEALLDSMVSYLKQSGYICETAQDFKSADFKLSLYEYDCIVVDIGLPDGSGLKVIERLKENHVETGVIIVSAKASLDDKIEGLNIGADDYMTKPFHLSELDARIKALIRRKSFKGSNDIVFNEVRIVPAEKHVYINDNMVTLTKKEYELLLYLIANPDKVMTKESIAEHLWGDHADMADSLDFIYSHIKNLRKKLAEQGAEGYVNAIYGIGYKFNKR